MQRKKVKKITVKKFILGVRVLMLLLNVYFERMSLRVIVFRYYISCVSSMVNYKTD